MLSFFHINDVGEFALRLHCSRDKNSGFLTSRGLEERAQLKGNGPYQNDETIRAEDSDQQ